IDEGIEKCRHVAILVQATEEVEISRRQTFGQQELKTAGKYSADTVYHPPLIGGERNSLIVHAVASPKPAHFDAGRIENAAFEIPLSLVDMTRGLHLALGHEIPDPLLKQLLIESLDEQRFPKHTGAFLPGAILFEELADLST